MMKTKKYLLGFAATIVTIFVMAITACFVMFSLSPRLQLVYEIFKAHETSVVEPPHFRDTLLKKLHYLWTETAIIDLGYCDVSNFDFSKLAGMPDEFGLYLRYSNVTDTQLKIIAQFSGIVVLDLMNCKNITDAGMREIGNGNLENMWRLLLSRTNVTDTGVRGLKNLPKLKSLCLSHTLVDGSAFCTDDGWKNLRTLHLDGCVNIIDESIHALANLENLQGLYLSRTNITDAGVHELRNMPNLVSLDLSHTPVDGSAFCTNDGWKNLQMLYLIGNVLTDDFFDFLPNLPNLKWLSFSVNDDNHFPLNIENLLISQSLQRIYIYGKNLDNYLDNGLSKDILERLRDAFEVRLYQNVNFN